MTNGKRFAVLISALLSLLPATGSPTEARKTHFFINSLEGHIQINEDPRRSEWQKPDRVIEYLMLKEGDSIADIGAGTGYFTVRLAKAVGPGGSVYAVDIEEKVLAYLRERAAQAGLRNIKTILAHRDDPLLPSSSVDAAFISNSYFFLENRENYLKRIRTSLKAKGRLAVVDYLMKQTPGGPPLVKRVPREQVVEEARKAGFLLEAEYYFLPYQYYLVFVKE